MMAYNNTSLDCYMIALLEYLNQTCILLLYCTVLHFCLSLWSMGEAKSRKMESLTS